MRSVSLSSVAACPVNAPAAIPVDGYQRSRNDVKILHKDGRHEVFGKTARYRLLKGEVARLVTGTGGGYGPPSGRPPEKVAADVRNGYLTTAQAEREYGVRVDPKTFAVLEVSRERTRP